MNELTAVQGSAPTTQWPKAMLRVILVCDLVDSTGIVERLGDQGAAELIRRHDRIARVLIENHGGREIDKTDGFLVLFERPSQAIGFALEYQQKLRDLTIEIRQPLSARVGVHVGDVMVWDNVADDVQRGAKRMEVEGLAKPVAARLMSLAVPGQILVSGVAYALAQRGRGDYDAPDLAISWLSHGRYRLKGVSEPMAVFEVGEVGQAPMRRPPNSGNARRVPAWWQRPQIWGSGAIAILGLAALSLLLLMRAEPALKFAERDWVVIGDIVNVNAGKELDGPLATAFRVGIEQSQFLNVMSDMQVRQALGRMQRSDATQVSRDVASEVALREHARAVIQPSVTQFGDKLRITVELIDPHSLRSVWSESKDAKGPDEILSGIDALLRSMRGTLGESLNQIESTSQPLEKVTTRNLDALRAYSRAQQLIKDGDIDRAIALLNYATELDPGFATAYARRGSLLYAQQRYPEARAALDKALRINGRLSERERLYIRAHLARFDKPQTTLDLWRTYAELYPDLGIGQNNLGNFRYTLFDDYAGSEAALREAAATRQPLLNFTLHALGYVLLAQEKINDAEQQFRASQELSPATMLFGLSDALIAHGRLDDADRYLREAPRQVPIYEVERAMRRATLFSASGQVDAAIRALNGVFPDAERLPIPNARWRVRAALVALEAARGHEETARELGKRHLSDLVSSASQSSDPSLETMENLLYAAAWAARLGLDTDARQALALARERGALADYPVRIRLAVLAEAELQLHAGDARGVAARLLNDMNGTELWEAHELRARALRAMRDVEGEVTELQWLHSHRGLAHAEWIDQLLGQQARVLAAHDAEERLIERAYAPPAQ